MKGNSSSENNIADSYIKNLAQFLLKSQSFRAIIRKDEEPEFYRIIKSGGKISELMFPMVVQAIKTGSRADQLYLKCSDVDYMYEVGPLVVGRKQNELEKELSTTTNNVFLHFSNTKNAGFYTISDKKDGYLFPVAMQSKLAPIIREVKQVASLEKTSAALLTEIKMMFNSEEDSVIALKCQEWPDDVWKNFEERNLQHLNMQQLKGDYIGILFLV